LNAFTRLQKLSKYFFIEVFGEMLADRFRYANFSPVVFDDPPFLLKLVDLSSDGFSGNSRCLTDGKSVRALEVLHTLRIGRRLVMNFDAVALAGIKSEYVMMSDLTEHNWQNEVTLKLPVEKVEIADFVCVVFANNLRQWSLCRQSLVRPDAARLPALTLRDLCRAFA
jgi:hypothetical protein